MLSTNGIVEGKGSALYETDTLKELPK